MPDDNRKAILSMMQDRLKTEKKSVSRPAKPTRPAPPPADEPVKPKAKEALGSVLIVEGNARLVQLLSQVAVASQLEPRVTPQGFEVSRLIEASPPRLVVLGLTTGGMAPPQVAEAIRALPNGLDLPILAVVENDDRITKDKMINAGVSELFCRPFDPARLKQRLRALAKLPAED